MDRRRLNSLSETLARCACALLVAFVTGVPTGMHAAARTPDLFGSASAMAAEHQPPQRDDSIVRRRAVRLNPFAIGDRVRFNLFDDVAFEGRDLSEVAIVGSTYGEIDLEALAAAAPDIIVTTIYPADSSGEIAEDAVGYGFNDLAQQEQVAEIAPIVTIAYRGSAADVIERVVDLAESLGEPLGLE